MMLKSYLYSDRTQLSAHFNVQEFRCECGKKHNILISDDLINKLEILFKKLDCSKIIVTSGHRCSDYDKSIGNSGVGQHINGNAADICCYDKNNQPISSKIVCCVAQDVGFGGIANITKAYIYTHVDVRTSNTWYGDEVINYHTVTNDFYQYFGISKDDTTSKTNSQKAMKGIDVSRHNGTINWNQVKADGVQFAILRAGYGNLLSQKDSKFEEYYQGAKAVGIPIGCYWYSYAVTPEDARKEAEICLSVIQDKELDFPIYFDLEEKKALNTGKINCSNMIRAFCGELEQAGYCAGLYMSRSHFVDFTDDDIKTKYAIWLAEYSDKLHYDGTVGMWQKSSTAKISGINGIVDINECYVDYAEKIRSVGLNRPPLPPPPMPTFTTE